jgi:hypothetical protein
MMVGISNNYNAESTAFMKLPNKFPTLCICCRIWRLSQLKSLCQVALQGLNRTAQKAAQNPEVALANLIALQ